MKMNRVLFISDGLCLLIFFLFLVSLPKSLFNTPTSYVVEARNGELLNASIASDGQWRFPVTDTIPEKFIKCITAFEDQRFYSHPGIDPIAMFRAIRQNLQSKGTVSGGSTITMQVVRLSRKKHRNIWQKLIEVFLAFRLEFRFSKNEIMQLYASNAPFGSNVVGLEAASWRYYGRKPTTLSWGEMATLAVLPNSPSLVHPGKNSIRLLKKRNNLLDKLARLNVIDQSTAELSKAEPIPGNPIALPQNAPHLLDRFKQERNNFNIETTRLRSTIDNELQIKITELLKRYQNRYAANDINNVAALLLNVKTAEVLSYVGNSYQPGIEKLESYVDMIKAPRSPGSTLKPLLYACMLTDGLLLPHTLIQDVPTQIGGYQPQNYDLGYDGAIPANKALSRSLNIPAVKMLQQYKYERFYHQLKQLNYSTLTQNADHYGLSLILGGSEVTMWDLARSYMGMARTLGHFNDFAGKYDPHDYDNPSYVKSTTRKFSKNELSLNSVFDHGSIWATFNAMEEVMRPGEEGLWEQFSSSQQIAWKTGTSFGFRDAWAIGLTPDYVVCIWVGNADGEGRPGLMGIEVAAPILFDIFKQLPKSKWFQTPKTKLIPIQVCKQSGFKAGQYCDEKTVELVPVAGEKTVVCPYHKLIHLDATGQFRVTDACESVSNMVHKNWFVLPPTMEYYYKTKNTDYQTLPSFKEGCADAETNTVMDLIYPKNNAVIYIPIEFDGRRGKVIFTAAHRNPSTKIYWHIDENFIGITKSVHELAVDVSTGKHTLTLVDENGKRLVQIFTILDRDQKSINN